MFEFLKVLHMLALLAGGAAAIGGGVLMRRVAASGRPPDPVLRETAAVLGDMGVGAIVVLWLTGIPMAILSGAFAPAGWAFTLKLLAATVVLVLALTTMTMRRRAAASGGAPDMAMIARLSRIVRFSVVAAVVLAVIAFG